MNLKRFLPLLLAIALLALAGWAGQSGEFTDSTLKSSLAGLGYEPKDLGDGLYEITVEQKDLTVPLRAFLSKSKLKLWLSVTVMLKDGVAKLTRDDLQKLLEKNVDIGPAHFMIEAGVLKIKMPIDNRGITPAILRKELDYIGQRVSDTRDLWQKKQG
jgi:hypothetical protein